MFTFFQNKKEQKERFTVIKQCNRFYNKLYTYFLSFSFVLILPGYKNFSVWVFIIVGLLYVSKIVDTHIYIYENCFKMKYTFLAEIRWLLPSIVQDNSVWWVGVCGKDIWCTSWFECGNTWDEARCLALVGMPVCTGLTPTTASKK